MKSFFKGLTQFLTALLDLLKSLPQTIILIPWLLKGLWAAIKKCFHRPPRGGCCLHLPPSVHVRPDPMIYDQYYLLAQGLAVTWDNPDIELYDLSGNPVSPYGLTPDQEYKVIVRVWNNSYGAPAAGLPVLLSFLSFGIGITSTPISGTTINLGVKGSSQCPAFASFIWQTPAIPGHYCLQALLDWPDDANPYNNLGQKNTQVGPVKSPALFSVPVHNQATVRRRFEIEADMYQLPVLPPCSELPAPRKTEGRYAESKARWEMALSTQAYGMFPVTADWQVTINPSTLDLAAGQTANVAISIEPIATPFFGTQGFNIHGFATPPNGPRVLAGGVTLYAQGS